jgi:hypothetical protein
MGCIVERERERERKGRGVQRLYDSFWVSKTPSIAMGKKFDKVIFGIV